VAVRSLEHFNLAMYNPNLTLTYLAYAMTITMDLPSRTVPTGDDVVRQRVQADAFELRTYRGKQAMELMRNDRMCYIFPIPSDCS
jgi:hypothetical protein